MEAINIGNRREVLWDEELMDRLHGIRVEMHRPECRGPVLVCDEPWEGNVSLDFVLIPDEGQYRLYYRGMDITITDDGEELPRHPLYL